MIEGSNKHKIAQDSFRVLMLLIICVAAGLVSNALRLKPLSLVYSTPQSRLDEAVKGMGASLNSSVTSGPDIDWKELEKISSNRSALILDARPEIYYRLSHIPSALSLPRDDFKARYRALQKILDAYQNKRVIVYCAGSNCQDSLMVANALAKLDYKKVQVFREGWSKWHQLSLPEEK
jgi:rhodanese-related sulfurtransferase